MQISGCVIRLAAGTDGASVCAAAGRVAGVTVGERGPGGVPLVIEANSAEEGVATVRALERLPGVLAVDVVFVEVEEQEPAHADD